MSDAVKHECGIAFVRLLKPLEYYRAKYGTSFYGVNKMYLLMEKQHNRGQDGAGIASIKLDTQPGMRYVNRLRSVAATPIKDIFETIYSEFERLGKQNPDCLTDVNWLKENAQFTGEVFLGHLRYGTFGNHSVDYIHPFYRPNNWKTRSLLLAGNFNLTNVDELFKNLIDSGQHPVETSDTVTVLEKIGHFLDEEVQNLYNHFKNLGQSNRQITDSIAECINVESILRNASKHWDGGYAMAGMIGQGDAFIFRDPSGIRPAFYYADDEIVVAASERPVIMTTFDVKFEDVKEIAPGSALLVKKNGSYSTPQIIEPLERKSCSFERIYFSRGTDKEIYQERKNLGRHLVPAVLKAVNYDLKNTVFSYIPNTASVAFRGLAEGMESYCNQLKRDQILQLKEIPSQEQLDEILKLRPRVERIAVKDVKLRTFITQDNQRDDLVAHVYDVTYGAVNSNVDTLVVLDDSIVRGTTLKKSILKILDRLEPKKIIIVSSAPQIRYPDCYGIDMAKLNDFIAFQAVIALLKDKKMNSLINEVYAACKEEVKKPKEAQQNCVRRIYEPFSAEQISAKITQLLTPSDINAEVEIIYQTIEDLHKSCPGDRGDWYFTGKYPTAGGNKVVNQSFINYIEGRNERAY